MNGKLLKAQYDLQQGMSISETCTKYGLTFKYLCDNMARPLTRKPERKRKKKEPALTVSLYIQKKSDYYYLHKQVDGKYRTFGVYNSLEDAERMRDYCMEHGWKQRSIDEYCRILGITRRTHKNNKVRYH